MKLDERLFAFARRKVLELAQHRADPARASARVALESVERRVRTVASLLVGEDLDVRPTDGPGGLRGDTLWLPAELGIGTHPDENVAGYLLRAVLAAAALHEGFTAGRSGDALERSLEALLALPATLAFAEATWPGSRALRAGVVATAFPRRPSGAPQRAPLACLLRRVLGVPDAELERAFDAPSLAFARTAVTPPPEPANLAAAVARARALLPPARRRPAVDLTLTGFLPEAADGPAPGGHRATLRVAPEALPRGTEREGRPRDRCETVEVAEEPDGDSPLAHVFEKLFTAEEHQGGRRRIDGSDDLEEHEDALDELDLRRVVRTARPAESLYRADVDLGSPGEFEIEAEAAPEVLYYDEWDQRRRRYRRRFCALHVERPKLAVDAATAARAVARIARGHAASIHELRRALARLEQRRAPRARQRDGSDVDLDALVDHRAACVAARKGATTPDDARLFVQRLPDQPELATLVLLDTSLSTDAWVAGRRVLDVARDAVIVLSEVLEGHAVATAIGAFHSNSRHDCRYLRVKDFADPWTLGQRRLLGLRPTGYTRIGPALRHAVRVLERAPVQRRLLLLVSDGKPTDHDRYEGRHGVADVRQALREARRSGIVTFALAIDSAGRQHLPAMFGTGGFRVLTDVGRLPECFLQIAARWAR